MINSSDGTSYKRTGGKPGDRSPSLGIQRLRAVYVAVGGETSIDLSTTSPQISYQPGYAQLTIKRSSGGNLIAGLDYFESTTTSIGFPSAEPLLAGEWVEIIREVNITGIQAATPRPDVYSAVGVAGQTTVTASFSWPYNMNSSFALGGVAVHLHGALQTRGVDYTEVNLGTSNTNQIQFVDALVGGENIILVPTYQVIDQSAASTTFQGLQIAGLQAGLAAGTQGFVDTSSLVSVPNTAIVNRAKIPDLANDLKASMGIERISNLQIAEVPNEAGPNGERVWSSLNDDRGIIRFVGTAWRTQQSGNGNQTYTNGNTTDYTEITFYGTGLNLLSIGYSSGQDIRASVDGGAEGSNLYSGTYSSVSIGRNYAPNMIFSAAANLTLGLHTVKIRNNATGASSFDVLGFEILGPLSAININPGTSYQNGLNLLNSTARSVAYNSGFESGSVSATRGGRVIVYQKADGTIAKSAQTVNAAQANLTSADHTNEELVRTYYPREFGAGRVPNGTPEDFSIGVGAAARQFTLEDGSTSLSSESTNFTSDGLFPSANGNQLTFTFIGTGLDLQVAVGQGVVNTTYSMSIDNVSIGTGLTGYVSGNRIKVVSGLPYGSHVFRLNTTSAISQALVISKFHVYQPKKPIVPTGAFEIADYNVIPNLAGTGGGEGLVAIAPGAIRKSLWREVSYGGTGFTVSGSSMDFTNLMNGQCIDCSTNGSYIEFIFFGTGFDPRGYGGTTSGRSTSVLVQVQNLSSGGALQNLNTTNFPSAFLSQAYGGWTYSPASAILNLAAQAGSRPGSGGFFQNLPLALWKVRMTNQTTGNMAIEGFDIFTPIHSYKSNSPADLQNTLPVGSCSMFDSRQSKMIANLPATKPWAQATGIFTAPTTTATATPVPFADMSVTIKTTGGPLQISYSAVVSNNTAGQDTIIALVVDGVYTGFLTAAHSASTNILVNLSDCVFWPVNAGTHKIDLFWSVSSGTGLGNGAQRHLSVREL